LEAWVKAADITKHITPHKLRHTFATHLYGKTGNLLLVQRAMGHKDLGSTQIYTHLPDDSLEEALEQL
jgi:integrase/recombinase XerC